MHQKTEFEDDVLAAVTAFKAWPRLTRTPQWAPTLCSAPPPSAFAKAHISASGDESTHGKKLYHLYAMNPKAYFDQTGMVEWGDEANFKVQSLGAFEQVLIKDAFVPVRADGKAAGGRWDGTSAELSDKERDESAYDGRRGVGGSRYVPGEAKGQFVMIKYPAVAGGARPGTDEGWVYATVDTAGVVTSAGRVASCMECHTGAPHGRLFGLESPAPEGELRGEKTPTGGVRIWKGVEEK
jgi:hypothetical protein